MARRPTVYVTDEDPKDPGGPGRQPDRVAFAIAPIDAFTGRMVRHGLRVRIADMPTIRPVLNQSGLFVFINIDDAPRLVRLEAEAAGYFDAEIPVRPPADPADAGHRLHTARLLPRPDRSFADGTTLVRGLVVRDADGLEGVLVTAEETAQGGFALTTRTDAKGAFVVPLRLATDETVPGEPVEVTFTFGTAGRAFDAEVLPGRAQSFAEPIDLEGTDVPPLVDPQPRPAP
jgi:hypothetical protein